MLLSKAEIQQNYELVCSLTIAQMKSRYRKTFAGFVWVVLNPILTFGVQAIIFKHILKIQLENYFVYLMAGIVPWVFMMSSVTMTTTSLVTNRSTLMAFKVSPWVFLVSQILDNFINFLASYFVLIFFINPKMLLNPWLLPLFLLTTLLLVSFVFFLCFFLSALNVFFRDTQYIVQFVSTLAIFITPVFYPVHLLPENYQTAIGWNPFYIMLRPFQKLIWNNDLNAYFHSMGIALLALIVMGAISTLYWRRKRYDLFFRL